MSATADIVEHRDDDGFTPLHLAVIAGNLQMVNFLLANGADVNAVDNEEHSVVHWATVCGENTALQILLATGAPASTPDVHGGYPLHYAAQMCGGEKQNEAVSLQVLDTLLRHRDVSVSVTDVDGRQPLLWAASAGSAKAVSALVVAGASVALPDMDGLTALHCAASRGHTECLDTLINLCAAKVETVDHNGCTALHYAVTLGHADATALLLRANAHIVDMQDRKGRTAAHCGCARGQFETVKLLAQHGAHLWLRNARGDLPLHEAVASGRRDLVEWLLAMRPNQVNAKNRDGRCPLHLAAFHDNTEMCKVLLDAGAQINPVMRTSKNVFMTPMDCALHQEYRSTAKYLQLHGGVPASRLTETNTIPAVSRKKRESTPVGQHGMRSSSSMDKQQQHEEQVLEKAKAHKNRQKSGVRRDATPTKSPKRLPQCISPKSKGVDTRLQHHSKIEHCTAGAANVPADGIVDFKNEIIINGRTEVSIHQVREITIGQQVKIVSHDPTDQCREDAGSSAKDESNTKRASSKSPTTPVKTVSIKIDSPEPSQAANAPDKAEHADTLESESINDTISEKDTTVESSADNREASTKSPQKDIPDAQSSSNVDMSEERETASSNENRSVEKPIENSERDSNADESQTTQSTPAQIVVVENLVNSVSETDDHQRVLKHESYTSSSPEINNQNAHTGEFNEEIEKSRTTPEIRVKLPSNEDSSNVTVSSPTTVTEDKNRLGVVKGSTRTNRRKTPQKSTKTVFTKQKQAVDEKREKSNRTSTQRSEHQPNQHKSFTVLEERNKVTTQTIEHKTKIVRKPRSVSEKRSSSKTQETATPLEVTRELSKSDGVRIPSLSDIDSMAAIRSDSHLSAPNLATRPERHSSDEYSDDNETQKTYHASDSHHTNKRSRRRSSTAGNGKHLRGTKSAGDDSGLEASPREASKWRRNTERGVNMQSVTQSIQGNIRRYHLERQIFQHLLDLKRIQIRSGQHNEAMLVKRAIDAYHESCASTVGAGRYQAPDYTFKSFETFLYHALKQIQQRGSCAEVILGSMPVPEREPEPELHPLQCTKSTHRCMHAIHAYTGVPCAAYLPRINHHTIPKVGFGKHQRDPVVCKPSAGYASVTLPTITNQGRRKCERSNKVTLELRHGNDKQIISLPTEDLEQNKRYMVTFEVKGDHPQCENGASDDAGHVHPLSD